MPTPTSLPPMDGALPTLLPSGSPPASRVTTCQEVRDLVLQWIANDGPRSTKRARVDGLIQGNPPYSRAAMVDAGRRDGCNVNWRTAEAFVATATGAIYDLFSEAPTLATVVLEWQAGGGGAAGAEAGGQSTSYSADPAGGDPDPSRIAEWSSIVTEEFDRLLKSDRSWDSTMQCSIRDTVCFGAGPLVFADPVDWRNRWVTFASLVVPDNAPSDLNQWEVAAILMDYFPHQLYDYIRDPEAAATIGWDVEAVRRALVNAAPDGPPGTSGTWEWTQQQLKQDSFSFSARSRVVKVAHFLAREFPRADEAAGAGRITHVMLVLSPDASSGRAPSATSTFLYRRDRCYTHWQEVIHPMYYSQGAGGRHYGVTGMGVKMYGAMESENRLLCNMMDKAFAPKIMFKPTTASGKQRLLPTRHGDYMVLPEGYDAQQVSLNSMIEEGLAMRREISSLVSANLSTYRQNLEAPKGGNPITRGEAEIRASDQARLGKTQHNRYYEQLDWLYEEKYRRACNRSLTASDPGGTEARAFQQRCKDRGVPAAALLHYCSVKATRVVGQGSQYLRQQTLDFFLGLAGALPEAGREHVIRDAIAARAGQYMVDRYYPLATARRLPSDQHAEAAQWVAVMKVGIPAVVTSTQNPMIYATTFLQAGAQALASLTQGGPPTPDHILQAGPPVLAFLQLTGTAASAHLQRMAQDPTRQSTLPALQDQLKRLAQGADQLRSQIERAQAARQREAQARQAAQAAAGREALEVTAGRDPDLVVGLAGVDRAARVKEATAQAAAALKARKGEVDASLKTAKTVQGMALADATTAAAIRRQQAESEAKVEAARRGGGEE